MYYYSLPQKIVKTTKKHRCWGCDKVFEKGSLMLKDAGIHIGEGFWNGWFCEKCASFIKTKSSFDWSDYQDGLEPGNLINHDDYVNHEVTPINHLKLRDNKTDYSN